MNSLFHKREFLEVQAIVPPPALEFLFTTIGNLKPNDWLAAFLVSFKLHRESESMLVFSGKGIGLSLVMAVFDQNPNILDHKLQILRDLILAAGGRINLHRDGTITWGMAEAMYPDFYRFQEAKRQLEPDNLLRSAFWERLAGSWAHV